MVRNTIFGVGCLAIAVLYFLMVRSSTTEMTGPDPAEIHYNLLVRGFERGQLSLSRPAPVELSLLSDPYDPVVNKRIRSGYELYDMSYYRGRMFLYFGVTPALVVFWPWHALTGEFLYHRFAVGFFCLLGFAAAAGILWSAWRRYFPELGVWAALAVLLVPGLATGVPMTFQRAEFWETAVCCGYAFLMLMLGALWLALHHPRRRTFWIAAGSLALGLAAGARPFLVLCAPLLLAPLAEGLDWRACRDPKHWPWRGILAAVVPVTLCVAGLMVYNQLRFDSPWEFGQRYQLAGDRQDLGNHFSLSYLWFNIRVYFLEPVQWRAHFPFVGAITSPPVPDGHAVIEDPFGALTNIPVLCLAIAAPFAWRRRETSATWALRGFAAMLTAVFFLGAALLGIFYGTCSRYQLEFLPALGLLAALGLFGTERAAAELPRARRIAVRSVWLGLLAVSVAFNLLLAVNRYVEQRCRVGSMLDNEGDLAGARRQYEEALFWAPGLPDAHSGMSNIYREYVQIPEALAEAQRAIELDPQSARGHNNLANALLDENRAVEAIVHYREAIRLAPERGRLHYHLAIAYEHVRKFELARKEYEASLAIDGEQADAHCNLANVLFSQGNLAGALSHYESALRIRPDWVELRNNYGIALMEAGRMGEAISVFRVNLNARPFYAEGHNNLGSAYYRSGRFVEARAEFQAAVRINPHYGDAANNLRQVETRLALPPGSR